MKLAQGVKDFWRVGRKLWQQDIRSVTQLEQIHCKHISVPATLTMGQSMANAGTLRSEAPRTQRIRCILPRGIPGITDQAAQQFQGLLDLIDCTDREQKLSTKSQNPGTGAIWHRSLDLERGTLLTFFSFLSLLPPNSGPSPIPATDDDDARWGRRRQRQRQTTKWPAGAPPGRLRPVRA